MAIILAQVQLESVTGLPEDRFINTFHFQGAPTDVVALGIASWIKDFYNTAGIEGDAICEFIAGHVLRSTNSSLIKFYDVTTDGPSGTPFLEEPWTLGAPALADDLPAEVALCLSFKANPLAGAIEARRRGRVYIGPLNQDVLFEELADSPRPRTVVMQTFLQAAQRLHDGVAGVAPWVIKSRAGDSVATVDQAWVDNAFDTQRRRGNRPTARISVAL